jgi:primosomal protein N'
LKIDEYLEDVAFDVAATDVATRAAMSCSLVLGSYTPCLRVVPKLLRRRSLVQVVVF